jgi:gamma-glutamyl-gamma-aminobutyrate hydrolase PuuD
MFSRRDWEVVHTPEEADLMQFVGGADVNPYLYFQGVHSETHFSSNRVMIDAVAYKIAQEKRIPAAGICRGGQFLWTMNGGQLFQHVNNHGQNHTLYSYQDHKPICTASSVHHQMMMDTDRTLKDSIPIAYAKESTRKEWVDLDKGFDFRMYDDPVDDMEIAVFPKTRSLCFQPHPEYLQCEESEDLYFNLIWQYLIPKG